MCIYVYVYICIFVYMYMYIYIYIYMYIYIIAIYSYNIMSTTPKEQAFVRLAPRPDPATRSASRLGGHDNIGLSVAAIARSRAQSKRLET